MPLRSLPGLQQRLSLPGRELHLPGVCEERGLLSRRLACGRGGESCDVCGAYESCSSGHCNCLGCVAAGTCYAGNTLTYCGKGGSPCSPCSPLVCQSASCSSGSCITTSLPDLTNCSGGRCLGGACCTGCIGGSACQPGTALTACGTAGKNCVDCLTGGYTACVAGTCQ